jgi:hypothetical protein
VQNWIFAHYFFLTEATTAPISATFYQKFLQSLHDQVCFIRDNLTPARNHRTIELYAIFLTAVVFPEFEQSAAWLAFARDALLHNLQTDLLPDGVQVELSTDYHHLVLKNYLSIRKLALLNEIAMPVEMDVLLRKGLEFALYAHKPDGTIPSLSDGDSRSFLDLLRQGYELYGDEALLYVATGGREGRPPASRSRLFPQSGYAILRSGWGERGEPYGDERYLIFDCGPLGAGNHGHLDLLNVELAAYGRSLVVDPGRYSYDESGEPNWRALFRGTSYHNTVQVDGRNQTRYLFEKTRYKIRGRAPDHCLQAFVQQETFDYLHGVAYSHEYPVVHERKILFARHDYWIISDHLHAADGHDHDYDLFFHLADEAWGRVETAVQDNTCVVAAPHLLLAQPATEDVTLAVEDGYVSRRYGVKHPAPVLRFACRAADATFHTVLYPYQSEGQRPQITITPLPVCRNNRLCAPAEAFALRITICQNGEQLSDLYLNAAAEGNYEIGDDGRPLTDDRQPFTDNHRQISAVNGRPSAVSLQRIS